MVNCCTTFVKISRYLLVSVLETNVKYANIYRFQPFKHALLHAAVTKIEIRVSKLKFEFALSTEPRKKGTLLG